jgi:hypothetical protein
LRGWVVGVVVGAVVVRAGVRAYRGPRPSVYRGFVAPVCGSCDRFTSVCGGCVCGETASGSTMIVHESFGHLSRRPWGGLWLTGSFARGTGVLRWSGPDPGPSGASSVGSVARAFGGLRGKCGRTG